MPASNQNFTAACKQVAGSVSENVARQLIDRSGKYGPYASLSYEQALQRCYPVVEAVTKSIESSNSNPLLELLDSIFEARLRSGYEPNLLLRVIDLYAEELIKAISATQPHDASFSLTVRRRMTFLNNSCKLHLANLNLRIPTSERVEIDPDLLKQIEVTS